MKILDHKDAINCRQDERLIIVETAIHRVSCLNRTVLTRIPLTETQLRLPELIASLQPGEEVQIF
jgi:hypothetical protein